MKEILLALIAIIPTTATAVSTIYLNQKRMRDTENQERRANRTDAKMAIQNMITQDILRAEVLGKMPENRADIEDEYSVYHKNGGNGRVTRQVGEYMAWYSQFFPEKVAHKENSYTDRRPAKENQYHRKVPCLRTGE